MRSIAVLLLGALGIPLSIGCAPSSTDASPGPATDAAAVTSELTAGERRFQGTWRMFNYERDEPAGELNIEGRAFQADLDADWVEGSYSGTVTVRADASPAQFDFTIEACDCKYEGMTSAGIYSEEEGGAIVLATPEPGEARPKDFEKKNGLWRLRR